MPAPDRLQLGEAALLCPTEAARLYGGRAAELVAAWQAAGIVYTDPRGSRRVRWGDVVRWSRGELSARPGPRVTADPWAALPKPEKSP